MICCIPVRFCAIVLTLFQQKFFANLGRIVYSLLALLPVRDSLFNPLIYAVRMRSFRVAFIQLLSRKTHTQADELEKRIFEPRRLIEVVSTAEQEQYRAGGKFERATLDNGQTTQYSDPTQLRVERIEETVF